MAISPAGRGDLRREVRLTSAGWMHMFKSIKIKKLSVNKPLGIAPDFEADLAVTIE